jgi:hypothetical protein
MRPQVVNDYLNMQDEGLVPIIKCGYDADHGRPFVRVLDDDSIQLWCAACDWTLIMGIFMYERMINYMAVHNLDYLKELKHG